VLLPQDPGLLPKPPATTITVAVLFEAESTLLKAWMV
jgi:hypothetical protein